MDNASRCLSVSVKLAEHRSRGSRVWHRQQWQQRRSPPSRRRQPLMAARTPDSRSSLTPSRSRSADALAKILRLHPRLPRALRLEEEPSTDAGPAGHMGTYSLETTAGGELAWRHTKQPNKWLVFMGECWCAPSSHTHKPHGTQATRHTLREPHVTPPPAGWCSLKVRSVRSKASWSCGTRSDCRHSACARGTGSMDRCGSRGQPSSAARLTPSSRSSRRRSSRRLRLGCRRLPAYPIPQP